MDKEFEWEYECCEYITQDSDGTHWTDWVPCSKEYARKLSIEDGINSRVRSIYNQFKE